MRANPGGYIPPNEVIGRDALIAQLWQILERQSVVLTAERRMGKTTIVRKMAAKPPSGRLTVYHELEHLNTPLEFVQIVYDDVREHLSRSTRATKRVIDFLNQLGGTEVGGIIKFPDRMASEWKTLLTKTIEDLVEHQERPLIFFWDEMPMMLDNIKKRNGEPGAMDVLNTLRHLRQTHPNRARIDTYYTPTERPFALNLLDALATSDRPLAFDELFNRLKSRVVTEDSETVRDVLCSLQDDHYISRGQDGTYQFRFSIIRRWWRLERGLTA